MNKNKWLLFVLFGSIAINITSCNADNSTKLSTSSDGQILSSSSSILSGNTKVSSFSSPYNEIKYEEYEYSEQLNNEILGIRVQQNEKDIPARISLVDLSYSQGNYKSYISTFFSTSDYYLCAYLNFEVLEIIENTEYIEKEDNLSWFLFLGINYYLIKYKTVVIDNDEFDYHAQPIKWYKIPKTEEIPSKIKDNFLISIAEKKEVYLENIDKTEQIYIDLIVERQDFYRETISDFDYYRFQDYIKILDDKKIYLIFDYISMIYNSILHNKVIIFNNFWDLVNFQSFDVLIIDGEKYVNVGSVTMWNEQDLKLVLEYKILENNEYMFKLEDLANLLV